MNWKRIRVEHINHGAGTVLGVLSNDEAIVEFDEQPKGWDKTLVVSINCLKASKSKEVIK